MPERTINNCDDCVHVVTLAEGEGWVCPRTDSVMIVQGAEPGNYWSMPFDSAIRSAYGPAVYVAYRYDESRYMRVVERQR